MASSSSSSSHLKKPSFIFILFFVLQFISSARPESFIGVNYGTVADNLPPVTETARLLKSTIIQKVRLYGADPDIIKALANTGIGIVVGAANGDIPALASDPDFAGEWVNSNVLAYPGSEIIVVSVGNEVMRSVDQNIISSLLPAMQNVQNALNAAGIGKKVKVSTVHAMEVLSQSDPPSSGTFKSADTMKSWLQFFQDNGCPFMINPYPYFAYQGDQRPETLAFCLFQNNAGRVDAYTNKKYMNMFDAQVDAVYSALNAMGFKEVEIVVAETGWPSKGEATEAGATVENARAYNGNLINHLRSKVGTPLMPGKPVDTYIFSLYDEDLKPGALSEKSFGLFQPNRSSTYEVGLFLNTSQTSAPSPVTPPMTPAPTTPPPISGVTPAATTPPPISVVTPAATVANPVANPLPPAYQAGRSVGTGMSCRPSHSLQIILVIMGAFMMMIMAHEGEDRYFKLL
ncbi:unnamed protein product [Cuscuta campestris]|uniref:glucan endo-1,3-beta-D-glucosidase n=1 Tax=Cuscuta campestris TaxID=132261 RepID=A0A484KVB9_9ASTE|nr:unnamed protein product [Cuscuta campestris]